MNCKELMTENPVCCTPDTPVQKAAQLMRSEDVGPIPVVEDEKTRKLVGILTDRDIVVKFVADGHTGTATPVGQIMTKRPQTCRPEDDVKMALKLMSRYQIRRVPVVDEQDRIVGIISQADVTLKGPDDKQTAKVLEEISK